MADKGQNGLPQFPAARPADNSEGRAAVREEALVTHARACVDDSNSSAVCRQCAACAHRREQRPEQMDKEQWG